MPRILIFATIMSCALTHVAAVSYAPNSLSSTLIAEALKKACDQGLEPCPASCIDPRTCFNALDFPSEALLNESTGPRPKTYPKRSGIRAESTMREHLSTLPSTGHVSNATTRIVQALVRLIYDPAWSERWDAHEPYETLLEQLSRHVASDGARVSSQFEASARRKFAKREYRLPCCGLGNDKWTGCRATCGPYSWRNKPDQAGAASESVHWNKTGVAPCCRLGWEFPYGCGVVCIKKNGEIRNEEGRLMGHAPPMWHRHNDWRYPLENGIDGGKRVDRRDLNANVEPEPGNVEDEEFARVEGEGDQIHRRSAHLKSSKTKPGALPETFTDGAEERPCCRKEFFHPQGCDYCIRRQTKSSPARSKH